MAMLPQLRNAGKAHGRPQSIGTPGPLLELERASIGGGPFDIDPATYRGAIARVGARVSLTKRDNGLRLPWIEAGRIRGVLVRTAHVNPPWEHMRIWMPRIAEEAATGIVVRAVLPLRPHRVYWRWPEVICFLPPVAFDGQPWGFPGPVVVSGWGMVDEFVATFGSAYPENTFLVRQGARGPRVLEAVASSADARHYHVPMAKKNTKPTDHEVYLAHATIDAMRHALHAVISIGVASGSALAAMDPEIVAANRRMLSRALSIDESVGSMIDLEEGLCDLLLREEVVPSERGRVQLLVRTFVHEVFGVSHMSLSMFGGAAPPKETREASAIAPPSKRKAPVEAAAKSKKAKAKKSAKKEPRAPAKPAKASKPSKPSKVSAPSKASKPPKSAHPPKAEKKSRKAAPLKPPSSGKRGAPAADVAGVLVFLQEARRSAPNQAGPDVAVKVADIAARIGVSRPTVLRELRRLSESDQARQVGAGPHAKWVYPREVPDAVPAPAPTVAPTPAPTVAPTPSSSGAVADAGDAWLEPTIDDENDASGLDA